MALRSISCINPRCDATIAFTSIDDLRGEGVGELRSIWRNARPKEDPLCIHERDPWTKTGMLSDLAVITIPAPAWVMARRKFGVPRDPFSGMPTTDDPYVEHPSLRSFYLPDELAFLPIPMVMDSMFGALIPNLPHLNLQHLSALTGLRYAVLEQVLPEVPGKMTIDRLIRYDTRSFWGWWQTKRSED